MAFQDYAHRLHTPFVQSPRGEEDAFVTLHSKNGFSESTPTGWNAMLTRKDTCLQCQVPCWLPAQNTQNQSDGNFSLHLMMQVAVKTSSSKSLPKVWLLNRMGLRFFLFTFCTRATAYSFSFSPFVQGFNIIQHDSIFLFHLLYNISKANIIQHDSIFPILPFAQRRIVLWRDPAQLWTGRSWCRPGPHSPANIYIY